jgi:Prokaryotic dksA/traR C4-type zinc finger
MAVFQIYALLPPRLSANSPTYYALPSLSGAAGQQRRKPLSEKTRFCERCKAEIPAERIEALEDTRLCVRCSEAIGGEFELRVSRENLGKAGSLKKNYGGVSVRKKRKKIEPL